MELFTRLCAFALLSLFVTGCGGDGNNDGNPFFDDTTANDSTAAATSVGSSGTGATVTTSEGGVVTSVAVDPGEAAIRVLAFGDSNVGGFGVEQPWADKLEIALGQPVFRRGVNDEFTSAGLARYPGVLEETNPTHVCIMHGVNDGLNNLDPSIPLNNLGAMVDLARARGAKVIVATLVPILTTGPWTQQSIDGRNDLDPRISPAMAARGAQIARVSETLGEGTTFMQLDGVHLNDAGHAVVAALFQEQIQ